MMNRQANRLISEKSPYLLQHAYNPVDWYTWNDEAFQKSCAADKPIFLSIGYSTCHWCHVMEKESFEDKDVARLMNETFVCIKVDREERPDLDNLYMTVCQMMTGSGGWPLTIIMTPDKKPFFAGTYFPKHSSLGRPGMIELISRINEIWQIKREELTVSADKIVDALQQMSAETYSDVTLDERDLTITYEQLSQKFDDEHGGFGVAPKFPNAHNILFLLRYWRRMGNQRALNMVEKTLIAMRKGGIYDHLGFGFHRYSTDEKWLVPHFEKMLYDQALLAMAYTEAYQAIRKDEYGKTAKEIFTYILRDMTSPDGGFYSAEDADSEGDEGKFYLWNKEDISRHLTQKEADIANVVFCVEKTGNFKEQISGLRSKNNILHQKRTFKDIAADLRMSEDELNTYIGIIRQKLFSLREKRVHPLKDDKILVDWNGLMIASLSKGGQVFSDKKYSAAAMRSANFIISHMRSPEGRLFHRYRDGQAALPANADDYAFFIWGLLELYESTFDTVYIRTAMELNEIFIQHYWDESNNGFYFTADDGEDLLIRRKEIYDGAIPSGNSVAMMNLLRLGRITANTNLEAKAMQIAHVFSSNVKRVPSAYTQLMTAVDFSIGPSYEISIIGYSHSDDTAVMLKAIRSHFIPNKVVVLRPLEEDSSDIINIAGYTKYQSSINDKATAYVCRNQICQVPTTDAGMILKALDAK